MIKERPVERENSGENGVFEETAKLEKVMMWGSPGTEAVLGQLIPPSISCFYSDFNVPGARDEFEKARSLIESKGVEVVPVQDTWAKQIEAGGIKASLSLGQLKKGLYSRGVDYYETYKDGDEPISDLNVLDWIEPLLEEDITRYGENAAIVMNERLSLSESLPLSNVMYARDQSNMLGSTLVWSSMRHEIRQPEVELYKQILTQDGVVENGSVQVGEKGLFEGGDGIVNNGIVYVGVGGRTNLRGVEQMARSIIEQDKLRLMVVFDHKRDAGVDGEMEAMHLDTFWMPSAKNEVVACPEEVARRTVFELRVDSNGNLCTGDISSFAEHLKDRGIDFVPISKKEQESHASNFLNLGNNEIIQSLPIDSSLRKELESRGATTYSADLFNITKGYGGLHCMTAALRRV